MPERVPVSVVIPTVGRGDLLSACLESLAACDPAAAEIILVDQSGDTRVADEAERFSHAGARALPSSGRGIALAMNEGMRAASHDFVLVTHDDCTVAPDWVVRAHELMTADPEQIVTGRVVPVGDDPESVPSIKDDPTPCDFDANSYPGVLWPANMAASRSRVLEFGGFDERFTLAAEDTDLSYRWLRAGRPLRYRPEMVVWHHDWRAPDGLRRAYLAYHRGQGHFFAKHLRQGDRRMLRYLAQEYYGSIRFLPRQIRKRLSGRVDRNYGVWRGVTAGFLSGWRIYG